MFSCVLGMEEETALSIIDPVTVNMEVSRRATKGDVSPDKLSDRILEVQIHNLSVRLSYHDMRMFIRILNSLPKQTRWARSQDPIQDCRPANIRHQVNKLSALGFHFDDCEAALERCNGQLDDAALWLTQNAVPADCSAKDNLANEGQANLSFDIIHVS
ncbi:unnamed protein product, partial [Timema podura]|nr:unnamed protein product [Timema podura]